MKNIKTLAVVGVLGLAICGFAIAEIHHSGGLEHGTAQFSADPAATVKHIAEVFAKIAEFDSNKDGKLDATEKEALAKAIAAGSLQLPGHTPPEGVEPTADMMLTHIAKMYACVAAYDTNHDGALNEAEQAALRTAIENGEFNPHGPPPRDGGDFHH